MVVGVLVYGWAVEYWSGYHKQLPKSVRKRQKSGKQRQAMAHCRFLRYHALIWRYFIRLRSRSTQVREQSALEQEATSDSATGPDQCWRL